MKLFHPFRNLISRPKNSDADEYGPDLFEFARMKIENERSESISTFREEEERKRKNLLLLLLILLLLLPIAFIGGYIFSDFKSCSIERKGIIHTDDGAQVSVLIRKLHNFTIVAGSEDQNGPEQKFDLQKVTRIDFLKEEIEPEDVPVDQETSDRELTADEKRFLGRYLADISGHRATMFVYATKKGYVGISLKFHNWGRGEIEYMRRVRVRGNNISFLRSCSGSECARIGSPAPIRQNYEGSISEDLIKIEGSYGGGQNASRWSAIRKR